MLIFCGILACIGALGIGIVARDLAEAIPTAIVETRVWIRSMVEGIFARINMARTIRAERVTDMSSKIERMISAGLGNHTTTLDEVIARAVEQVIAQRIGQAIMSLTVDDGQTLHGVQPVKVAPVPPAPVKVQPVAPVPPAPVKVQPVAPVQTPPVQPVVSGTYHARLLSDGMVERFDGLSAGLSKGAKPPVFSSTHTGRLIRIKTGSTEYNGLILGMVEGQGYLTRRLTESGKSAGKAGLISADRVVAWLDGEHWTASPDATATLRQIGQSSAPQAQLVTPSAPVPSAPVVVAKRRVRQVAAQPSTPAPVAAPSPAQHTGPLSNMGISPASPSRQYRVTDAIVFFDPAENDFVSGGSGQVLVVGARNPGGQAAIAGSHSLCQRGMVPYVKSDIEKVGLI